MSVAKQRSVTAGFSKQWWFLLAVLSHAGLSCLRVVLYRLVLESIELASIADGFRREGKPPPGGPPPPTHHHHHLDTHQILGFVCVTVRHE